ncbi:hypothetical protein QOZ80_2BG0152560 [Eleusine coracana subsp. coracana]|nr:hypothetical protein QOZ80_2BG0152560 [Eleusine coracana subsp. coracana]
MEKLLLSSAPSCHQTLPDGRFVVPAEHRPPASAAGAVSLPVIDLSLPRDEVRRAVLDAGKELGFFQIINHGVPEEAMSDMEAACAEFFRLPAEDKARYYSEDTERTNRLFSSTMYEVAGERYWRDCLRLAVFPVDDEAIRDGWPEKPSQFRDVLERFIVPTRGVGMELLRLLCEGIGLRPDYFSGELSGGEAIINVNHYPPCPDPNLTLGLPPHCDRNLITLLLQGPVCGLQVAYRANQWIDVDPIPGAFVVNFGHQLEIATNGLLKSVEHRAVTNSTAPRTSVATFIMPTMDSVIRPAPELVGADNPPRYRTFTFRDFMTIYKQVGARRDSVEKAFKL